MNCEWRLCMATSVCIQLAYAFVVAPVFTVLLMCFCQPFGCTPLFYASVTLWYCSLHQVGLNCLICWRRALFASVCCTWMNVSRLRYHNTISIMFQVTISQHHVNHVPGYDITTPCQSCSRLRYHNTISIMFQATISQHHLNHVPDKSESRLLVLNILT